MRVKRQTGIKNQSQLLMVMSMFLAALFLTAPLLADHSKEQSKAGSSAKEVVLKARHARAVWDQFPGFSANVTISQNGDAKKGTINVGANGAIDLKVEGVENQRKVIGEIKSLIGHRLPSKERELHVSYADECTTHPQGRLVSFEDDRMGSKFRIKEDVITEVYRNMKEMRFVISVIDINRSKEGKVLPRSYTVSTWDQKTNNLKSSSSVNCTWKRVGQFDLPQRIVTISTMDDGKHDVQVLEFSNLKLQSGTAKKTTKPTTSVLK